MISIITVGCTKSKEVVDFAAQKAYVNASEVLLWAKLKQKKKKNIYAMTEDKFSVLVLFRGTKKLLQNIGQHICTKKVKMKVP